MSVDLIVLVGPHAHPSEAALRRAGYAVRLVRSIAEALTTPLPQLIVLDILSETSPRIQAACCRVPVVGVGPDSRLVDAYAWGVTDYQPTTIDGPELAARAKRIIAREKGMPSPSHYYFESPTLSVWRKIPRLEWRGRDFPMAYAHWQIVKELARECGRCRTVHELARASGAGDDYDGANSTRVRINLIRQKLDRITGLGHFGLIVTDLGYGYRLALPSLEA